MTKFHTMFAPGSVFALAAVLMLLLSGLSPVKAAGGQAFLDSVDKSIKIAGQMASGKVPYNPARAVKEMKSIQKAIATFETDEASSASANIKSCASQLKAASMKGEAAAKAGVGAFKAVYGDLLNSYKACK